MACLAVADRGGPRHDEARTFGTARICLPERRKVSGTPSFAQPPGGRVPPVRMRPWYQSCGPHRPLHFLSSARSVSAYPAPQSWVPGRSPGRLSICYVAPGQDLRPGSSACRHVLTLARALARDADVSVVFRRVLEEARDEPF